MDKQTIARLLLQPNKNFPIDCETIDSLQTNIAVVQVLGNLVGDKAILYGCESEQNNTRRKAGYVFLRTKDYPAGEVILWEGGNSSGGIYVNQEVVSVSAQGYDFPQAYVHRSLAPGVGVENYVWSDFTDALSLVDLMAELQRIRKTIEAQKPAPLGLVEMWAGQNYPDHYLPCEGQQLRQADYPELYAAIGSAYNNGFDSNGQQLATVAGMFRLPDLRSRFVVGQNPADDDYKTNGAVGGEKTHTLTVDEMPSHSHALPWDNNDDRYTGGGADKALGPHGGVTQATGGGKTHENRPPYYALSYVMRVR